jgi:hypothetical protein
MADHLSERDDLTLRTLAFIERTTVAEQRRQALREYAARARQDKNVAEIVRLMLASRRERQNGGDNVIRLERTRSLASAPHRAAGRTGRLHAIRGAGVRRGEAVLARRTG